MSAFKQEDPMMDFTQYFNIDQAASASQAQRGKTVVSPPQFTAPGPETAFLQPQPVSQQFQGPSHNYGSFRQQNSLPSGAMANAMQQRQHSQQMVQQQQQQHAMNPSAMSHNGMFDMSQSDAGLLGMDLDLNDLLGSNSPLDGFVDPHNITDLGDASPPLAPVQRLYPGMHAAKAQQEQLRRQQQAQQQQQQAQKQQQHQQQPQGHQRRQSQGRNKPIDPEVEQRISLLLKQMRNNTQSGHDIHGSTPQPQSSGSQHAKSKKDEEDMDDDERLLASEEGKKLSSKERRQLRNKVSARAFRSRRKEYISQLEGEINGKNTENDDLRHDNDMLRAENGQLTDLVRMLLGHPAFGSVLEDLSARGASVPILPSQNQTGQQQQQQQQQQHRDSIAMSQASTQGTTPNAMDFANTPIDGWNSGLSAPDFNFNPSVFAVTELPEHPALEPEVLAGKASEPSLPALPALPILAEKETMPVIERPTSEPAKTDRAIIVSREDGCTESPLFATELPTGKSAEKGEEVSQSEYSIFGSIPFEKATARIELVSVEEAQKTEELAEARFSAICARLDGAIDRLSNIVRDL